MSRNVRGCFQFPGMGRSDSLEFAMFLNCSKNSQNRFSLKIVTVVAGVSDPSRILLNLVSESQKVREI